MSNIKESKTLKAIQVKIIMDDELPLQVQDKTHTRLISIQQIAGILC